MAPVVVDAPEAQRYEARLDGDLAGVLEYVVKRGRIGLVHTEVAPAFEGRGVAAALARFALDDARARELRVIASCPYVRSYLAEAPRGPRHRRRDGERRVRADVTPAQDAQVSEAAAPTRPNGGRPTSDARSGRRDRGRRRPADRVPSSTRPRRR